MNKEAATLCNFENKKDNIKNNQSVLSTLFVAIIFLLCSHLAIKEFFSSPLVWIIGISFIVLLGLYLVVVKRDEFGFILTMFVCTHFSVADNQGGIWSYVFFAVIFVGSILHKCSIRFGSVPVYINILSLIFLFHQIIGTITNNYSIISNIQSTVIALSQLLIFYYFATQEITQFKIKRLYFIWFVLIIWLFFMALNQYYHWFFTPSPLLPQRYMDFGMVSSIPAGSFGNSELFAEYFCMVFALSLVVMSRLKEFSVLRISFIFPLLMVLISSFSILMGASRSAVILSLLAAIFIFLFNFFTKPSFDTFKRIVILFCSFIIIIFSVINFGEYFGMKDMVEDFSQINLSKLDVGNVISGKGINRSFTPAYHRLSSGSWWIGNGYNLPENNVQSLGLVKGSSDYHSLYLCLPFFYGWLGSLSFVLIVFFTFFRLFILYFKNLKATHLLMPIAFSFFIIWGIFLIDQYKISITRNPSYFFMIWILLGLSHAIANSIQKTRNK